MKRGIFILATLVLVATGAYGHSKAEETLPADKSTVQAVEVIEIHFDDPMRVTAFAVKGTSGEVEIERETGLEPVTEFRALPAELMRAGTYEVEWRGLSSDGHPMQGTFSFTVSE